MQKSTWNRKTAPHWIELINQPENLGKYGIEKASLSQSFTCIFMYMANMLRPLARSFYDRDTTQVARELLGKLIVHRLPQGERIGRIVEVEAYLGPHDLAAHTSKGITDRTHVMFGPPGHVYVYLIYGMHHCMNVVTESDGTGAAVLLRALEPVSGMDLNTRGPGRLCKALGIDRSHYGADLCGAELFIAEDPAPAPCPAIVASPRIGVDYAGEWASAPLRFYLEGNPYISKIIKKAGPRDTNKKNML